LNAKKISIIFFVLGLAQLLSVFVSSWGAFPVSDLWLGMIVCCSIMAVQVLLVSIFIKSINFKKILFLVLSVINTFFFVFVLTSWSRWEYLGYCCLVCILFLMAISRAGASEAVLLSLLIVVIPVGQNFIAKRTSSMDGLSKRVVNPNLYRKNLYIIGIDGMVSRLALQKIYESSDSVAYEWLENNNFKLYDINSAGDQTLTTYGALLTGNKNLHPRAVRPYFNGSWESEFYSMMRGAGYKIQFFYESDYFGTDAGMIDSFQPKSNTLSICSFIDKRWGFYFCDWVDAFGVKFVGDTGPGEKVVFYKNNAKIHGNEKWISINHMWFPGHTVGNYDGSNPKDFEVYREYYLKAQNPLKSMFEELVAFIKKRDPDPVIVFMGDHGAYALRSNKDFILKGHQENEMAELKRLDARSALLAIYPKNFCENNINANDTSNLFLRFADCLEGY